MIAKGEQGPNGKHCHDDGNNDIERLAPANGVGDELKESESRYTQANDAGSDDKDMHEVHRTSAAGRDARARRLAQVTLALGSGDIGA